MPGIVGPIKEYVLSDGTTVPLYIIQFDKRGNCTTPRSQAHLLDALAADPGPTDFYLFSHGWNNTPQDAITHYQAWVEGYTELRQSLAIEFDRPYRPVLVGIIWPSIWLVPWWERGPAITAGVPMGGSAVGDDSDATGTPFEDMLAALAEELPLDDQQRFYDLASQETLAVDQARELLRLAEQLLVDGDDELPAQAHPSADELLNNWDAVDAMSSPTAGDFNFNEFELPGQPRRPPLTGGSITAGGTAGEILRSPLSLVRVASVWQMKDRAGKVGRRGVAQLLRNALSVGGSNLRSHLVGHSFGAKVVLSAISSAEQGRLPHSVNSLLLLQPAVNQYAFADEVPESDEPGGYRVVLSQVEQPILTTFSDQDKPLRWFFHLGLRRDEDVGERREATGEAPSRFAALGGYGPANVAASTTIPMGEVGESYPLTGGREIIALAAHDKIDGHSDVANPATYWALLDLVSTS